MLDVRDDLESRSESLNILRDEWLPSTIVGRLGIRIITSLTIVAAAIAWSAVSVGHRLTVRATGLIEPEITAAARPLVSGRVSEVLVRSGDVVRSGEIIARLDPLDARIRTAEARAQLESAELELRQLQALLPLESLKLSADMALAEARVLGASAAMRDAMVSHGRGNNVDSVLRTYVSGTHVDLDRAVAALRAARAEQQGIEVSLKEEAVRTLRVEGARARVRQRKAELASIEERQRRLEIFAPIAGVVTTRDIPRLVGTVAGEGAALIEIADAREWKAVVLVREQHAHRITAGDHATIDIPALASTSEERVSGTVASVDNVPVANRTVDERSTAGAMYRVTVLFSNDGEYSRIRASLREGFNVQVRIVTATALGRFSRYIPRLRNKGRE